MKLPANVLQTMRIGMSAAVLTAVACDAPDAPDAPLDAPAVSAELEGTDVSSGDAEEDVPPASASELRASFARPVAQATSHRVGGRAFGAVEARQSQEPIEVRAPRASFASSRIRVAESTPVQFEKPKRVAARRTPRSSKASSGAWTCGPCGRG